MFLTEDVVFKRLPPYGVIEDLVGFPLFVVYHSPSDYPGKYVVRVWHFNKPTFLIAVADSYEDILKAFPSDGLTNWGRTSIDDPCIVETWF